MMNHNVILVAFMMEYDAEIVYMTETRKVPDVMHSLRDRVFYDKIIIESHPLPDIEDDYIIGEPEEEIPDEPATPVVPEESLPFDDISGHDWAVESIVYLFDEERTLAIIGLADEIKEDSYEVIEKLYSMNKKVIMLTGDNDETAKAVADKLNIKEVISNATPKEKLEKIKGLGKTLMVGDGINDSPALKTATVGVSVANGSDISADSSDIVLLTDNMNNIVDIFDIGNKTIRIIKQNLFWALFYNVCMIPLATGLLPISLNPMIASLAMTLSSFTVVINSLRLL